MPAACRYTCASALLAALVAAEWVEISQHRYRKPLQPARFDSHPLHEQAPSKYTPDQLAPAQHPFLNHNAQNPTKNYQDVDSINTNLSHDVTLEDPISEGSYERDLRPGLDRIRDLQIDRLNPFIDNSGMRNTYDYEHESKNNYFLSDSKKPMTNYFSSVEDLFLIPTRETYANHIENNRHQKIRKQNNVRSDIDLMTKESTYNDQTKHNHLLHNYNDRNDGTDEKSKYVELDTDKETTKIKKEEHGSNSGKVERVSNIGSVKRVNLANTPVKSPTVKLNEIPENLKGRNDIRPSKVDNISDYEWDLEADIFKNTRVQKVPLVSTKNLDKVFSNSENIEKVGNINIPIAHGDSLEKDNALIETTETVFNNINGHKFTPKRELMTVTTETITANWRHHDSSTVGELKLKDKKGGANNRPNKPAGNDPFVNNTEKMQDKKEQSKTNSIKSNLNANSDSVDYEHSHDEEGNKANSENNEKTSGEVKVNTMEKVLKFLKVVAETISKNTRRGSDGKITYLNELKHSLLTNIKERIEATWHEEGPRRHSRSARGHVEFPSSESALMTISFLTFAVFLIKLVLQVIQTYKHKSMLMAPLVVATAGRTLSTQLRTNT